MPGLTLRLPARPWRGGGDGMQGSWLCPHRGQRAQAAPRLRQLRCHRHLQPFPAHAGAPRAVCWGSRTRPVSHPLAQKEGSYSGGCGFPEPSSPPLRGTVAVSERKREAEGVGAHRADGRHTLVGPHVSAVGSWGFPSCSGNCRTAQGRFTGEKVECKVFLLPLPRHASLGSGIRDVTRGLRGSPAALHARVQSPRAVVLNLCSWPRSLGKHFPKPTSHISDLGSSQSNPGSRRASQQFCVKVKHFLAQAHKLKTYHCSYQVFISLQHPHLMEAQCSPQLDCYEPWVKALLALDTSSLTWRSDADCSEGALWC